MANNFNPKSTKTQAYESDCKAIHDSWGKLSTMVRTLATRTTPAERREIKETYKAMYGEDLPSHLHKLKLKFGGGKSGNCEESKFCVKTCEALSLWMADPWERDACLAKEAIELNETDYKALVEMFVGRKSSHVLMIKQAYQTRYKRQLDQDIVTLEPPHPYQRQLKKIHSTQFEDAIKNVVECIHDPPKYYAKMLHRSMKGGETSKGSLTRLVVSRAEIDMGDIQEVYRKKYGVELKNTLCQTIPAGEFRDFLLALVNNA